MARWIHEALESYMAKCPARFHVPGHKGQNPADMPFGGTLFAFDVTELADTDDAHQPQSCILRAQEDAARAFGAKQTIFLTNGATVGVMAMIAAACRKGRMLVGRDSHKSAVNALALFNAEATLLAPDENTGNGLPLVVSAEAVRRALSKRQYAAVLITSPNYYGCCADLPSIASACREYGALLLVDQSHGSHLRFISKNMPCASFAGADMWVDSAHKTLCALTQSAYLHFGERAEGLYGDVRQAIGLLQSSSPSFLLLCGLEACADIMAKSGAQLYGRIPQRRAALDAAIGSMPGLSLPQKSRFDPARLVVGVSGRCGGMEAQRVLTEHGVIPEMADLANVVFLLSPWDPAEYDSRLIGALDGLQGSGQAIDIPRPPAVNDIIDLRLIMDTPAEWVPLSNAPGCTAARAVGPIPPGCPAIWPGEVYTPAYTEYLSALIAAGTPMFNLDEANRIKVIMRNK